MISDVISFELAKYLKQLGYSKEALKDYWPDGTCHYGVERLVKEREGETIMTYPAPEPHEVVDFLWEKNIAYISYRKNEYGKCSPVIIFADKRRYIPEFYYQYPSQAIKHCLEVFTEVSLGKTKLLTSPK